MSKYACSEYRINLQLSGKKPKFSSYHRFFLKSVTICLLGYLTLIVNK